MNPRIVGALSLFVLSSMWTGCSSQTPNLPAAAPQELVKHHHHVKGKAIGDYIKHVFVIVQENRSLNNLFMGFPGANTQTYGEAGAVAVPLQPEKLEAGQDIDHRWIDATTAYNGGLMNGFNQEFLPCGSGSGSCQPAGLLPYSYVPKSEIKPYWDIANQWVLAANFYPTEMGPSFTSHLNIIASTTEISQKDAIVDFPKPLGQSTWGCADAPGTTTWTLQPGGVPQANGPFPCFNQFHTVADLLDKPPSGSPIPWRYYAPALGSSGSIWSAFSAIKTVYKKADWPNVVSPQTQILNDIPKGKLNNVGVVWVVPDLKDSDHAGPISHRGPSWVASVVNTIGESNLWKSSVIVVLWDDWGGWYDPSAPPQLDFRGLGIRTPMLIISPYDEIGQGSNGGFVSQTRYEPGSILRFVENVFNLPPLGSLQYYYGSNLGYTDQRSASIGNVLDTSQSPRAFTPINSEYSLSEFLNETPSYSLPDE